MKPQLRHPLRRRLIIFPAVVVSFCFLAAGCSALSNRLFPSQSPAADRLSDPDKARLAEALHLRRAIGDLLWQGWGSAQIPMILYNEEYAFLTGFPDPPAGWLQIQAREIRGGPWEEAAGDTFEEGELYFQQLLLNEKATPPAFTVMVGERWVSSLPSRESMEIGLANEFRQGIPAVLQPVVPYRMAARLFLSAAGGRAWYICAVLHESFHAYQGMRAPSLLSKSENIYIQYASRYPWDDADFAADWQAELNTLADAVQAESDSEALALVRRFLDLRLARRHAAGMDATLIDLERLKEWEEGLAKYTELAVWRLAADPGYQPLPVLAADPDFHGYGGFAQRWSQEVDQIRRMANDDGDLRFYYSGWAQAVLLDRLAPGWRARILTEGIALEDILQEGSK
jgi:hypothetical protein